MGNDVSCKCQKGDEKGKEVNLSEPPLPPDYLMKALPPPDLKNLEALLKEASPNKLPPNMSRLVGESKKTREPTKILDPKEKVEKEKKSDVEDASDGDSEISIDEHSLVEKENEPEPSKPSEKKKEQLGFDSEAMRKPARKSKLMNKMSSETNG